MDSLDVVMNLLKNYQINMAKIKLIDSEQGKLEDSSKASLGDLKQQMNLLNCSINCLNEKEKTMIDMIFKQGRSLNDVSKVLFTVKSNVHKMGKKAIKTIAKIYDELKK